MKGMADNLKNRLFTCSFVAGGCLLQAAVCKMQRRAEMELDFDL